MLIAAVALLLVSSTVGLGLSYRTSVPLGAGDGSNTPAATVRPPHALPRVDAAPSAAGEGSVLSTIDLVTNQTLPGDAQPASQNTPESILYDPVNGDLYVRGYIGTSITVLDGSTRTAIDEIGVPASQNAYSLALTMAVDTSTGAIYTSNAQEGNLSIINGSTNSVTGTVSVGGEPNGMAFDPANGYLYVTEWSLPVVAVVNGATNELVTTIPVGEEPGAIVYDSASDRLFVANFFSDNVSVINPSAEAVVANVVTGSYPNAFAVDTVDDLIDVANSESDPGTVTVIPAASPASAYNVSVGLFPDALGYAESADQLFVANGASNNVSIIDQKTATVVVNRATGNSSYPSAPEAVAFDAVSNDVYVLNSDAYNVSIFSVASDSQIGSVDLDNYYAYGLAVDTASSDLYAVSEGSYLEPGPPPHAQPNATVISAASNRAIASIPLDVDPWSVSYDPGAGLLVVPDPAGNDTYLVNPATDRIAGEVPVGLLPKWAAVDPTNGEVYVVDDNVTFPYNGTVTVLSADFSVVTTITTGFSPTGIAFDATNGDFYVPDDLSGNVTVLNGSTNRIVAEIIAAPSANLDSVGVDPQNGDVFVGDLTNDTVGVIDPATEAFVGWLHPGFGPTVFAFDTENGTAFLANEGSDNISVVDVANDATVSTLSTGYSGPLVYDSANNLVYIAQGYGGSVEVINASTYLSAGSAIPLGTVQYPHGIGYDPADQRVYVTTEYQGSVSVIGAPVAEYAVTFSEVGLPSGTDWSVVVNGTGQGSAFAQIVFQEPNGSDSFSVAPASGYQPNVTAGTIHVNGGPVSVEVRFTSSAEAQYSVSFVQTGLGDSTSWRVSIGTSGVAAGPGRAHNFTEPAGSYNFTIGNVSGYSVSPQTGDVPVTDHAVDVNVTFTNLTAPSGSSSTPSTLPPWIWIAGAAAAAALVILLLVARRRKRSTAPSPPPAPTGSSVSIGAGTPRPPPPPPPTG